MLTTETGISFFCRQAIRQCSETFSLRVQFCEVLLTPAAAAVTADVLAALQSWTLIQTPFLVGFCNAAEAILWTWFPGACYKTSVNFWLSPREEGNIMLQLRAHRYEGVTAWKLVSAGRQSKTFVCWKIDGSRAVHQVQVNFLSFNLCLKDWFLWKVGHLNMAKFTLVMIYIRNWATMACPL